ncbi:MAG: enoyl-CoA hydratase/isomerase family protein [Halioglobus sp.]
MTDTILYSQVGHVGRLTLNNPEQHNSLGADEFSAIQHYLEQLSKDDQVRVLIVTGTGSKTFCAGASLKQLGSGQIDGDSFQATTDQLASLAIPTICSLNGNVFGGGVELALSCDFRIGIEGSRLRVPAAAIGLCYPLSGMQRFVERLGINMAKRILLAAEEFDAQAMLEIGFLDHLVEAQQLERHTASLADNLAAMAPLAVRAMKDILQQAATGEIDMDSAKALSRQCQESTDLVEGFTAQREKRTPIFTGN